LPSEAFSLIVAIPSNVTHVALRHGSVELDEIEPSQHAPTLAITSPDALDTFTGVQKISWTAADADGDALKFAVLHSSDGGVTWTTLALDLSEPEFSVDASKLPGSSAHFQVLATDGWFTTEDTVGPVTLPGDRPWRNPTNPFDANRNSSVEPLDALVVINELNQPKFRDPTTGLLPSRPANALFFYDTTGDGFCTPLDVLRIINFLNNGSAEGESDRDVSPESQPLLFNPMFVDAMRGFRHGAESCEHTIPKEVTAIDERVPAIQAASPSTENTGADDATGISCDVLSELLSDDRLLDEQHLDVDAVFALDLWN
jgi:hypothetical protein